MDNATLEAAFRAHTEGATQFTRRMAIDIGDFFGEKPRSVVVRLESMGLLKRGSWQWFIDNGGITKEHVTEARADRRALPN